MKLQRIEVCCISLILICCFFSFFINTSWSSNKPIQLPQVESDLDAQQNKAEQKGFVVLVKPIHLISELENYFGQDLLSFRGIIPVQIKISNKSYGKSCRLYPLDINLINPEGLRSPNLSIEELTSKIAGAPVEKSSSIMKGVIFILGGVIVYDALKKAEQNQKLLMPVYDPILMKEKEIGPDDSIEGCAFFPVSRDINTLNGWKLNIILIDPSDSSKFVIEYGLSGKVDQRMSFKSYDPYPINKRPGEGGE